MTVLTMLVSAALASPQSPASTQDPSTDLSGALQSPVVFVENRGQWAEDARFLVDQGAVDTWITDKAIWLAAERRGELPLGVAIRLQFVGGVGTPVASRATGSVRNYIRGNDPRHWVTGARAFERVEVEGLYAGTDLVLREQDGHVEYDLVFAAGADVRDVAVRVAGHDRLRIARDGSLVIDTAIGELRQTPPRTWITRADGSREPVECRFELRAADEYGFAVADYDRGVELTIDPGLLWGSFLGGTGVDVCNQIGFDSQNRIVTAGTTTSTNLPSTPGVYRPNNSGGTDAFLCVFAPGGGSVAFLTYLGGNGTETLDGFMIHTVGGTSRFAMSGSTSSTNFPLSTNRYQASLAGGTTDAYVAVLSANGATLEYGSYFGGQGDQEQVRCWVQPSGWIYLAGRTTGIVPTTPAGYQNSMSGPSEAFVTVINRAGPTSSLQYSSLFGGNGDEIAVNNLHVAPNDIATVGMTTNSTNVPAVATAYQSGYTGTTFTGQIFCLQATLSGAASLVYSSYFGAPGGTTSRLNVQMDPTGMFGVTATTSATTWVATAGAMQPSYGGGASDGLVCRLNPGSATGSILYLSYVGGTGDDVLESFHYDPTLLQITAVGSTSSDNLPLTPSALQFARQSVTSRSGYVALVDPSQTGVAQLLYASFVDACGQSDDAMHAVVKDAAGVITMAGETTATIAPASPGTFQRRSNGATDGIIVCVDQIAQPPAWATFGAGCGAPGFTPGLVMLQPPRMCQQFQVAIGNVRPNGAGLMFLGFSASSWNGNPLPRDLASLGAPGCQQLISTEDSFLVLHGAGTTAQFGFMTPASANFYGLRFYCQYAMVDAAANALGWAVSNAGEGVLYF
jgi:hypothetical protein